MALIVAFIVAACLGLASTAGWAAPTEQKKLTDWQITTAVNHAILTDAALFNNQIYASVTDGVVTLSGTADNLMDKERAAKITETVRGVRAVVNTLALQPTARSDDGIRGDVEAALLFDAATDSYDLKTTVKAGVVTLRGKVNSYREKLLAAHVAKSVKGVKELKDDITVTSKGKRSDAEIADEVRRSTANDVWLAHDFIRAEVKDGAVTLTGTVGSAARRGRAVLLAWTAGVKSVNAEGLKIEPWAKLSDQRKEPVAIKDPQIKQAVQDAFVFDPRVFSFNVRVEVENGAVTLTGLVDNLKARRAAEQDARNTVGVWRVKNLLRARPVKPIADGTLAQNVESAFLRDPKLDGLGINVKVKNGVVTLTGAVDTYYEKAAAEDIASLAHGVLNVKNNLTVGFPALVYYDLGFDPFWDYAPFYSYWDGYRSPYYSVWPYISDAQLKDDIEYEMFWSPSVALDDIAVKVTNGVATLTGAVNSWFEFYKATEDAYLGGATEVYNNITIR